MAWPVRTRICIECRAALSEGEHCTWVRHTVVAPAEPGQQQKLIDAVWPTVPADTPVHPSLRAGRPRTMPSWDEPWGTLGRWYAWPPAPDERIMLGPYGASEEPLWTARSRYTGRVRDDAITAPSPLAGAPCVAYGLWLLNERAHGSSVLLRDGASLGFDVVLDDGQVARIPAGTVDVIARGVRLRRGHTLRLRRGHTALRDYLHHLHPGPKLRPPSPLPFREAREAILEPGDPVTLLVELHPAPDVRALGSAYRHPAAGVLAPAGRTVIRIGPARQAAPGRARAR